MIPLVVGITRAMIKKIHQIKMVKLSVEFVTEKKTSLLRTLLSLLESAQVL